ncbi:hypothetical protein CEXT_437981 [Caerostris extrusa]|uniref:Uncharacterized protein n=1 Tax=Caerostris extrusa TaxID=172846 RepID=A0AAV4TGV9_CAEEX|nr:hypothetical protein CEXT_437981 [Caerostris extrusa]
MRYSSQSPSIITKKSSEFKKNIGLYVDILKEPISWINQESISFNLFSIWNKQERFHPNSRHLDQSGINLIQYLSSGSIRNGSQPICFIWNHQEWISSNLFHLDQSESISSNLISSGSNRNLFHAISSHLDQSESALIESLSSGTIGNRSHPISSLLDHSQQIPISED